MTSSQENEDFCIKLFSFH